MADQGSFFTTALKLANNFLQAAKEMAKPILEDFGLQSEPITIDGDDLDCLKQKLGRISAAISAAENLKLRDKYDKLWLGELRDLECMATDIVEEFEYEELHSTALHDRSLKPQTRGAGERRANEVNFSPPSYLRRKLEKMIRRHQEVASDRKALRLRPEDGIWRDGGAVSRPPSTSVHVGEFYGRAEEVKQLIKLLIFEKPHCNYSVVPIVGMPGVGKTALAQHVYNHESVASHFDLKAWVCVADGFGVPEITKAMIEEITGNPCGLSQLNALQKLVGDLLTGKRFLLILDDLRNVQSEHWERFQIPFAQGAQGSKVIVTSGCIRIAHIITTSDPCHLKCLSDDICWSICKSRAFFGRSTDPSTSQEMSQIGEIVVKKCGGLPLAAKALGCSFRSSFNVEKWQELLENDLNTDDEFVKQTLPTFIQIYDDLPAHLKRCFAYCSLFPKGHMFEKHQLVRLWIAQGFIAPSPASGSRDIEEEGAKYFYDLVGISVFQTSASPEDGKEMYVMHDLFHELAQLVAGDEFCRTEGYELSKMDYRTRHFSLSPSEAHSEKLIQFEPFDGQYLRSFLFIARFGKKLNEFFFTIKIAENILRVFNAYEH